MSVDFGHAVDVATLADLLRETEQHHGAFEAADQYMKDVHHVVRQ
jgi:hypothetical protein